MGFIGSVNVKRVFWSILNGLLISILTFISVSVTMSISYFILKISLSDFNIIANKIAPISANIATLFFTYYFSYQMGKKLRSAQCLFAIILVISDIACGQIFFLIFPALPKVPLLTLGNFLLLVVQLLLSWQGLKWGEMSATNMDLPNQKLTFEQIVSRYKISLREKEVISLILLAMNNKEIAQKLFISEGTVKNHLKSIFKKLNIRNRVALVNIFKEIN